MIKRHLTAFLYRTRCDRKVLLSMVEKMSKEEAQAFWRLLQAVKDDSASISRRTRFI